MNAGIKSLKVKGFSGFASEVTIDFTSQAKNMIIYGENGSGKTSIMTALKLLFDSADNKLEFTSYKNIFTDENPQITIETKYGNIITLKTLIDKTKRDKIFSNPEAYGDNEKTYLDALSKSTSILSYRELMKIYDMRTDEDFYDLFIRKIMAYYLIPPRKEKTLKQELNELEELKNKSPRTKKKIELKENSIINEINKIFYNIKDKWNEYVRKFTGDNIEVDCSIKKLGNLNFKVKWNSKEVRDILNYLNEGRLNAVSLGLFLAYYKIFNTSPYKLLLLDDVVIGLDMSLRIPLLDILKNDFEDEYQIIITTFDDNWFNLMKNYLSGSKWRFCRLVIKSTDNSKIPFLIGTESVDYLQKAIQYLSAGDFPASALYIRLEFERLVKEYAKENGLKVKFGTTKIEDIWNVVKGNLRLSSELLNKVNTYKSILLNPAVHYDTRSKYRNEVKDAIQTVKELKQSMTRDRESYN